MRTICAWCKAEKCDDGDPSTADLVSHGICQDCADKLEADARDHDERLRQCCHVYADIKRTAEDRRKIDRYERPSMPACQRGAGL